MESKELSNCIISTIIMKSIAHNFGACSVKTDFGFSAEDLQKDDHNDYNIKKSVSTFNDLEYTIIAKIMEGVGYFNCCLESKIRKDGVHFYKPISSSDIKLLRDYLVENPDAKILMADDIFRRYREEFPKDDDMIRFDSPRIIEACGLHPGNINFVGKDSISSLFMISPISIERSEPKKECDESISFQMKMRVQYSLTDRYEEYKNDGYNLCQKMASTHKEGERNGTEKD
jgi:hypothetical protein